MVAQDVPYVIGVGVSPKDNHVEVAVLPEQYEREQDAVREAYGRVALEIVASERDQGSACTRYDCWDPPFKGGLSIRPCVETLCVRGQRQRVLVRAPSGKSGPDDDQ